MPTHRDQQHACGEREEHQRERHATEPSEAQRAERQGTHEHEPEQLRYPQAEQEPAREVRRETVRRLAHRYASCSSPAAGLRAGSGRE